MSNSNSDFACESCGKQYKSKCALTRHCKISKSCEVINELKNNIQELQTENDELKNKNNKLQQSRWRKKEEIKDLYKSLTYTVHELNALEEMYDNSLKFQQFLSK